MAARQHQMFVVENAVSPDVGPGALDHRLDHRWACESRQGNRDCKRGWGKLSGIVLLCKIRDMPGDYRHGAAQVCPTAGRLGKASERIAGFRFVK